MSLARIHYVTKSRKAFRCPMAGGHEVPVGSPYQYFHVGFRGRKQSRCMDHSPRPSERESSMLASVFGAVEAFEDNLTAAEVDTAEAAESLPGDIEQSLQEVADACEEVADQYREAAEAMGEAGYEMEEKADALAEAASEATNWAADGDPVCDEHADDAFRPGCEDCAGAVQDIRDSAMEHVGSLTFDA